MARVIFVFPKTIITDALAGARTQISVSTVRYHYTTSGLLIMYSDNISDNKQYTNKTIAAYGIFALEAG